MCEHPIQGECPRCLCAGYYGDACTECNYSGEAGYDFEIEKMNESPMLRKIKEEVDREMKLLEAIL